MSTVSEKNLKGNVGKKFVCCPGSRDVFKKDKQHDDDVFSRCNIYVWDSALQNVPISQIYPGNGQICPVNECGSRCYPVPISSRFFGTKLRENTGQLRWCCPKCFGIGRIYQCKCVPTSDAANSFTMSLKTYVEDDENLSSCGDRVEYYGCSWSRCWFKVIRKAKLSKLSIFSLKCSKTSLKQSFKMQLTIY